MILLALPALACDGPVASGTLGALLSRAESALSAADDRVVEEVVEDVLDAVGCLGERVAGTDVARLHRLAAIVAWMQRDRPRMEAALRAAKASEPGFVFPTSWLPPTHPVVATLAQAAPPVRNAWIEAPARVVVWVDGVATARVDADLPVLIQLTDGRGGVVWSDYRTPGEPLLISPSLPVDLPPLGAAGLAAFAERRFRPATGPLLIVASAAGVATAGLFMTASGLRSDLLADPSPASEENNRRAAVINGVAGATIVTAVVTVGASGGAVLTVRW